MVIGVREWVWMGETFIGKVRGLGAKVRYYIAGSNLSSTTSQLKSNGLVFVTGEEETSVAFKQEIGGAGNH